MDEAACRRAVEVNEQEEAPVYYPMPAIYNAFQAGLALGFADRIGVVEVLTLRRALKIALDTDNAAERWLAGEPFFLEAALL